MFRTVVALIFLGALSSSAAAETFRCTLVHESFLDQANRFILAGLRFQPVEATQAGYHGDANHPLDNQLDDSSPASIAAEHALLISGKQCFATAEANAPEDVADLALLRENIESGLFDMDVRQSYRYRPQDSVEMIGSGLFFPLTSTEGTEQSRLTSVVARMERIPRIL